MATSGYSTCMRHGPDGIELAVYDQIGEILGVEVRHHDDGSTQGMFDAVLAYPDGSKAALEVTSNQSAEFMRQYAENRRNGRLNMIGSADSPGVDNFAAWLDSVLDEDSVSRNFAKLDRSGLLEQHLVLIVRGTEAEALMYDMSVSALPTTAPKLPSTCTDLWVKLPDQNFLRWNRDGSWSKPRHTYPTSERIDEYKSHGGAPGC